MSFSFPSLVVLLISALHVLAESHTVRFQNNCGTGTPKLIKGGVVVSTGEDYTSNGPLESSIAYLDRNGECGFNGEHCTMVEMNLNNPSCPGCGSSVDISLIPDHAFNVETSFEFYGGDGNACDGLGAVCADARCSTAFFVPDDNQVQRACQADNVNLLITFCGGSTTKFTEAIVGSLSEESSSGGSSITDSQESSSPSTDVPAPASSSSEVATSATSSPTPSSPGVEPSEAPATKIGVSSAQIPSAIPDSSSVPSASTPTPLCNRKKLATGARRAKRTSSFSRHARAQSRARALSGFRDSKL